jgi:hypothetical protein
METWAVVGAVGAFLLGFGLARRRRPPPAPPPPPRAAAEDLQKALEELVARLPEGVRREAETLRALGRMEGPRREVVEIGRLLAGLASDHDGGCVVGDPAALRLAVEELARGAKELRAFTFGDTVELHARPESAPPPLAKAVVEAHGGSLRPKSGALVLTLPRMPDVVDRRVY